MTGVSRDLEASVQNIHDAEVQRNRDRVCEVVAFLTKAAAEIEQAEDNSY